MALNCVWLNKLKFSQRKSKPVFSVMGNFLKTPKSKLTTSGQVQSVAADVAECESRGDSESRRIVRERSTLRWILIGGETERGLPARSGREPAVAVPLATPALSPNVVPLVTVNGVPVWATVMPETCQPRERYGQIRCRGKRANRKRS